MKISVRRPDGFDATLWQEKSDQLIKLLSENYGLIVDYEEMCNWTFSDFLPDESFKPIAVMVFGSDLPSVVDMVENLVLIGDGDCPVCGSNRATERTGGFTRNEYDQLCILTVSFICKACGHEREVNDEDY